MDIKGIGRKITTGIVKLAYAYIFEAYAVEGIEGYEPRYSTTIIIPKTDIETLKAIKNSLILRDGDLERPGDQLYKGCYFLNANSKNKPGIVDPNVNPIVDPIEVKNGCYARVSFNLYGCNSNSNKGIATGLNNIQFIGGAM